MATLPAQLSSALIQPLTSLSPLGFLMGAPASRVRSRTGGLPPPQAQVTHGQAEPVPATAPPLSTWPLVHSAAPARNLVGPFSLLLFPHPPAAPNGLHRHPSIPGGPKSNPASGAAGLQSDPPLCLMFLATVVTCHSFERVTVTSLRAFAHAVSCLGRTVPRAATLPGAVH